jgi:flagellin-like protein
MLFNNNADSDKRGQVGIGTLIVFIAMVLVAAIAAGVLVNTAGFLQETAEQTGAESQAQVSDRVQVVSAYGEVDGSNQVPTITLIVKQSAGSDAINLDSISYLYVEGSFVEDGFVSGATDLSGTTLTPAVLDSSDDRAVITITPTGTPMDAGDEFTLEFVTESGAKTIVKGFIPTTAQNGDTILF